MAISFSIQFAEKGRTSSQLHPADRLARPAPSRVLQLLEDHRPWEMMNNIALIIVDQTYAALREMLGSEAPPPSGDGHVEISRAVDHADPDSPLLCVNASAKHCSIRLINGIHGGGASPKKYRLARASVSVSPGSLHVARVADDDCWKCADVRPNVSEKGLFGVLDTIRSRLDAAIRIEASLIKMAAVSGVKSPKINEIIEARMALAKMRAELDVEAIMRRGRQKRRHEIQEIVCSRSDADQLDEAEVLMKRLTALHVSHKRCRPVAEMEQVDDADVLTKRLRTLHV